MKIDLKYAIFNKVESMLIITEVENNNMDSIKEDVFITIHNNFIKYTWTEKGRIYNSIYNGLYKIIY